MIGLSYIPDFSKNRRGKDRQQRRRRYKNCMKFSAAGIGSEYICRGRNARGNNTCEFFDVHGNAIHNSSQNVS